MNKPEHIAITEHARRRLVERGITISDIIRRIGTGEIIKQYEDDKPFPSCLILGMAVNNSYMCNIFQSVYETGDVTGDYQSTVLVQGEANIHDTVFDGDLILANGLREQRLDLNNITVKGRLVVWGGSEINIIGSSAVAGVVTPRNDGSVQVIFDAAAAELSKQGCSVVYPDSMDKGNKRKHTQAAKTRH